MARPDGADLQHAQDREGPGRALSPAVSLTLDSADGGQDIVLAEGRAELIAGAERHPHFLAGEFREKYARSLGAMSFDQWRSTFSQPLLIHVNRITAWTRTAEGVAYRVVP
jgi:hypothetical protein